MHMMQAAQRQNKIAQAHYINNRTMEVFRGIDGLAAAVKARSPPLALWRKFVYCDSLTGPLLGSVDHFQVSTEDAAGLSAAVHRSSTACRAFGRASGQALSSRPAT